MKTQKDATINVRIPGPFKTLIQKFVAMDTHMNESDFIRAAIKEKIQRDAPGLYKKLFEKESEPT